MVLPPSVVPASVSPSNNDELKKQIDDIMMYCTNQSQHTSDVKQVFDTLREHKFCVKFGKSQTEFVYLLAYYSN